MSLEQSAFYTDLGEMMKSPESASLFVSEIKRQERECIIKLLENEIDGITVAETTLYYLIELIKGETSG